jgi:hypothetical protein
LEIKNLTPHDVVIFHTAGAITIPPSGTVARVKTRKVLRAAIDLGVVRIGCSEIESLTVDGLPERDPHAVCIVSTFVAQHPACRGRDDILSPDLHSAIRDGNGNVAGISAFVRYS